jgi:hypothetical protein
MGPVRHAGQPLSFLYPGNQREGLGDLLGTIRHTVGESEAEVAPVDAVLTLYPDFLWLLSIDASSPSHSSALVQ